MTLLDLYCGAGGCSVGCARAGFCVVGVDIQKQPHYPFDFHQADAIDFVRRFGGEFDIIHASPPCQTFCQIVKNTKNQRHHPDLLDATRKALLATGKPYIIENVPAAPLRNPIFLNGVMFGLKVLRTRGFEIFPEILILTPPYKKQGSVLKGNYYTVVGNSGCDSVDARLSSWREAMGISWMNRSEITQAIPPAYTEYIGKEIVRQTRRGNQNGRKAS